MQVQILISGTGSNAINIIKLTQQGMLRELVEVSQVISNKPEAQGLAIAQSKGVKATCVNHNSFDSKEAFEASLIETIEQQPHDLIVLAGFMRILSAKFVEHFAGKIVNIHPSLLPAYKGLNTHQRALDAKESTHGVSVHLVIPDLDAGPLIGQAQLQIHTDDTAKSLQTRVQIMEYWLYPYCLSAIASGQVQLNPDSVNIRLFEEPGLQVDHSSSNPSVSQCSNTGMIICTEESITSSVAP